MPLKYRLILSWIAILAVCGGIVAYSTVPPAGWTQNDVTTGQSSAYPDLTVRKYDMPVNLTAEVAGAVAATVLHWKVQQTQPNSGVMVASTKSRLGLSTDEITVTVRPQGRNASVTIRSHSSLPGGDMGANARHIRDLQAAMDRQLPPGE